MSDRLTAIDLETQPQERARQILNDFAELAKARGYSREEMAIAMAMGAGDLCRHCSSGAELDRSLGAIYKLIQHRAMGDDATSGFTH